MDELSELGKTATRKQVNQFFATLIELLTAIERRDCQLTDAQRLQVERELRSLVAGRSKTSDQKLESIVKYLQVDVARHGCTIDPQDPDIQDYLKNSIDALLEYRRRR